MNTPRKIAILGALSAMAEATARLHAEDGAALVLAGRDAGRLETLAQDLRLRGAAAVHVHALDLAGEDDIAVAFERMATDLGGVDEVLLFYGVLGDQRRAERDLAEAQRVMETDKSYIFFREEPITDPEAGPIGSEGVALTPAASLAVDMKLHPLGAPMFVAAKRPGANPASSRGSPR